MVITWKSRLVRVSKSFNPAIKLSRAVPAARPLKVRNCQNNRPIATAAMVKRKARGGASRPFAASTSRSAATAATVIPTHRGSVAIPASSVSVRQALTHSKDSRETRSAAAVGALIVALVVGRRRARASRPIDAAILAQA